MNEQDLKQIRIIIREEIRFAISDFMKDATGVIKELMKENKR